MGEAKKAGGDERAGKLRIARALAVAGAAMLAAGIALGRGSERGLALIEARLALLVLGLSLALAGAVGLAAARRRRD